MNVKVFGRYKKQKIINFVVLVLVLVALLTSISALVFNFAKAPVNGRDGKPGVSGVDGRDAFFDVRWNGSNISIMNSSGLWGSWIDLRGFDGRAGDSGRDGSDGVDGRNGRDCSPNKKPVITLNDINGSKIYRCTEFVFWLNVSVMDPDDDDLQVDFYYSEISNSSYVHHETFFGTDGIYRTVISFNYPYHVESKAIYFMVVVWDGSDISLGYFDYTV